MEILGAGYIERVGSEKRADHGKPSKPSKKMNIIKLAENTTVDTFDTLVEQVEKIDAQLLEKWEETAEPEELETFESFDSLLSDYHKKNWLNCPESYGYVFFKPLELSCLVVEYTTIDKGDEYVNMDIITRAFYLTSFEDIQEYIKSTMN